MAQINRHAGAQLGHAKSDESQMYPTVMDEFPSSRLNLIAGIFFIIGIELALSVLSFMVSVFIFLGMQRLLLGSQNVSSGQQNSECAQQVA